VPAPVEFAGDQVSVLASGPSQVVSSPGAMSTVWGDRICFDSGMPCLIAAASTNTLNVEPAWNPAASPYFLGTT
jgi:hypothetical protein